MQKQYYKINIANECFPKANLIAAGYFYLINILKGVALSYMGTKWDIMDCATGYRE